MSPKVKEWLILAAIWVGVVLVLSLIIGHDLGHL